MRKRRGAIALICIGCLILLVALVLGVYNIWVDYRAGQAVDRILERMASRTSQSPQTSQPPGNSATPDYVLDPNREMPTAEIDGYLYIGKVEIPSLNLELPVMDTWDRARMKIAPCRYAGTAYLPGFVICAHNYTSHFGRLKNLASGDSVLFTDMEGYTFSYEVAQVEILASTAVEEMKSDSWDLTLFSCTLDGRARVTVRCRRVRTEQESEP